MHRTTQPTHAADLAPEDLAQYRLTRCAERQRHAMAAVRASDGVSRPRRRCYPNANGFLALAGMRCARDYALAEQFQDALLHEADLDHPGVAFGAAGLHRSTASKRLLCS
jgi:hypothetical protein